MKKYFGISALLVLILATLSSQAEVAQDSDLLRQAKIKIVTDDLPTLISETESDIKSFAENFEIKLDSKSKVTKPKRVTGSILEPVLKVSVQKCVFIICQTVDLDAQFRLDVAENIGSEKCDFKYLLTVDLSRSTPTLSELYSGIESTICMKQVAYGANVKLAIYLIRAATYDEGIVQRQAFDLIKRQSDAILESFISVLEMKGATEVSLVP